MAVESEQDSLDNLIKKWDLWKAVRITAWIARFTKDCRTKEKVTGINEQLDWIPRLRRLTKRVIRKCRGCKRFQVKAYADPPTANLSHETTTGSTPFKVIGLVYACPIRHLNKTKKEKKASVALYACSLSRPITRAVYLDLLPDQSTEEFLLSLKQFIARKGRSREDILGYGKTLRQKNG